MKDKARAKSHSNLMFTVRNRSLGAKSGQRSRRVSFREKSLISFNSWKSRDAFQPQGRVQMGQHSLMEVLPLNCACFLPAGLGPSSKP